MTDELSEDTLVALARSSRVRVGAAAGAALRDDSGRNYAGATVALPHLDLSALQVAVVLAVAAGAHGVEAAVVVGEDDLDLSVLRDLGGNGVPVHLMDARGHWLRSVST